MAFWIDLVVLTALGLAFPWLFTPSEYNEKIDKELKRLSKYFSILMGVVWWYGAGLLYLNVWRFDIIENLFVAFVTAIPVVFVLTLILYFYSKSEDAFNINVIGLLFMLVFVVGWLLVSIVTFVGMVLGAIVTGFTRFRSTWMWVWGGDKFGLTTEEIYRYGQTYFMWNGWLNIIGFELVSSEVVKSIVDNPFGPYWYLTVLAIIIFALYPFIIWGASRLTWKRRFKKFQKNKE